MRFYGFGAAELTTAEAPNLDLGVDPKLAWALRNRARFPVDLNAAPRELLLRVPGIGARSVDRILQVRRWHRVRLDDLARLRVSLRRALPFVTTADHNPNALTLDRVDLRRRVAASRAQIELFAAARSATTGEL